MFVHRLKLRAPQLLPTWTRRPAIERRFTADASVLSIVAAPGYGKTVLAAHVFASWNGPKAWYSLDSSDADLAAFSAHISALTAALPGIPDAVGDPSALAVPKELAGFYAALIADIEPAPLLVFDDVHALEGSISLAVLDELIERATRAGASFVVCGRSMPLLLRGVAARSHLASVGAADLAFDRSESRAYLRKAAPLVVDEDSLERLASRADGWPAGLALVASTAALRLDASGTPLLAARDEETQRALFDDLAAEVLASLDDGERRFLLETSILDLLERDTCEAVTESIGTAALLASLARRGLCLIRRSGDAYAVHLLLREFLLHALVRTRSPSEILELRRRAASALARRGDDIGQIAQLLGGGDLDEAAATLERVAFSMLASGLLARLEGFMDRIGFERIERSATLSIARGRLEHWRGESDRALSVLERAAAIARAAGDRDVLAQALRATSSIHAARGDYARLLAVVGEALSIRDLGEATRVSLLVTLGAIMVETGRYDEALATFAEVMPAVVARGDLASQGKILHNTAVAHVRRGEPYAGLAMYQRALKVKRSVGQRVSAMISLGNQIFVLRLLGDLDEAERLSRELLDEAYDVGNATLVAYAHENEGALRFLRGDPAAAARAYREAERGCDPSDVLVLPEIWHGLAQAEFALGRVAEADELAAKSISILRGAKRGQPVAPIVLLRARCAFVKREFEHALALACEAIDVANAGADSLLAASTGFDGAALLVSLFPKLPAARAREAERAAAAAAAGAVALLHQKNYRFLLRTKATTFAELGPHLRRWDIGRGLLPDAERAVASASLRIELLGGLRVSIDGEPLPAAVWKRRRARDIFAYLVSLRGRPVSRSRLIDLYWPETDADSAHDNLRVTISSVRKAVGDVIKFEANGYRFVAPPGTSVDTELFDDSIERGRQFVALGTDVDARRAYMAAVDLYRGDFLEGLEDGGWQWRERERIAAACLEALRWLVADREGDASFRRLMLERLLEIAPFEIDAVRMRLQFMLSELRLEDARRDYADWRQRYRRAVGSEAPEIWDGSFSPPSGVRFASVPLPSKA